MHTPLERLAERELAAEPGFIRPMRGKRQPAAPHIQRVDELLTLKFNPIAWAIRDMIPEGVTMLVGPPKVGKSWLTLQCGIAVASATSIWKGREAEIAGEVLILALEDNDRRMQSRVKKLRASGAELNVHREGVTVRAQDVSRLYFATEWPRMDEGGLDHLDTWLTDHPHARLVIIDTLGRFRPPENGRGSAYQADYAIGATLKPLADKHNVALVLIHHTRKQAAGDVLDTVSGTQGLTGSVDALLLLRRERGQMDAALYVTGRDIEHEQDYALQFDPETCTWSSVGSVHEARVTRERADIFNFLRKNGPSKPKDIAEGLEKKGPAIRRLLQKMFADAEVTVTDGRYSPVSPLLLGNSGNSSDQDHASNVIIETVVPSVTAVTGDSGKAGAA